MHIISIHPSCSTLAVVTLFELFDLKSLHHQLGVDVCTALVGFHPFTGCDSVSGFYGRGKIKPFKLMVKNDQYLTAFKELGSSFTPSDEVMVGLDRLYVICTDKKR